MNLVTRIKLRIKILKRLAAYVRIVLWDKHRASYKIIFKPNDEYEYIDKYHDLHYYFVDRFFMCLPYIYL